MGFLLEGVCYPSAEKAKQAICSKAGQIVLDGSGMHASHCISTDFSLPSFQVVTGVNGAFGGVHTFNYPEFPACEHTYSSDLIGAWLGAVLLLAATLWGYRKLLDLFSGKLDG